MTAAASVGEVVSGLSRYLCGTRYRFRRSRRWVGPESIASSHRRVTESDGPDDVRVLLGTRRWNPEGDGVQLRDRLLETLTAPGIVDLVVFGSHARGSTTGYSDLDAILLLDNNAADDAKRLRALRPHVLAAQRAALAFQPMQHHGFLVASERLFSMASDALGMPVEAVATTVSLFGAASTAVFSATPDSTKQFRKLGDALMATDTWPRHPWLLHLRISMFALLPTLYLQATGRPTVKHLSFEVAAQEFGRDWWPYEVLDQVRLEWPRDRRRDLEALAQVLRNPWIAVGAWRRIPVRSPRKIREALTNECLHDLRHLVTSMMERAR